MIVNTWSSLDLSSMSFEFMKRLKVMAMINEFSYARSIFFPQSIQSLTNLKTLRLKRWHLGDISFILSLEGLEVLDLQYCIFNEVPNKIEKLHNLKLLDLRDTDIKSIGRCLQLEEFYVSEAWLRGDSCTHPPQCFVHDVTTISLLRYNLQLGRRPLHMCSQDDSIMRVLCPQGFDVLTIDGSRKNLLQKAESVHFIGLCGGSKNIVPDIDQAVGCMNELNMLHLEFCLEIECLFDATSNHAGSFQEDALLPCRLIKLRVERMENLTEVCRGEPSLDLFKKLEELHISWCPQLHSIFPRLCNLDNLKILNINYPPFCEGGINCTTVVLFSISVAKNMQQLEELTIKGCPELRHLITSGTEEGANTREEISLAPNNSHFLFPNLKKLRISNCPKLQVLFPISCIQQNEIEANLLHLQIFELHDLENLLGRFPQDNNSRWPSVSELSWRNCPKLTTSWIGLELKQHHLYKEVAPDEEHQKPETSKLQKLALIDLPQIRLIWFSPTTTQILSFQYLQCLEIDGFKEMKFIFSVAVLRSLSGLTSLNIGNCDELVEIIAENEESKSPAPVEVIFPKLNKLRIEGCNKLKTLFPIAMIRTLPQLSTLHVLEAAQLKEIFGKSSEEDIVNEVESVVPNLREIKLENLPSFVSIYQGFMMHKVKLKVVWVLGCPKFTPVLGATQVILVHHRTEERLIVWSIALTMNHLCRQQRCPVALKAFLSIENFALRNTKIEGILQLQLVGERLGGLQQSDNVAQKHLKSNLERLYLYDLPELRFIWSGTTQFLGFHKLTGVEVIECPKLKTVFPPGIVESLRNLSFLTICDCEELEEIFDLQVESLPKLNTIEIKRCNKLKCVFFADCKASCHYASVLDELYVVQCPQLERIYGLKSTSEADNKDNEDEEVRLSLSELALINLPNFTEIGHGIKLKKQPMFYTVEECPKYIPQFPYPSSDSHDDVAGNSQL